LPPLVYNKNMIVTKPFSNTEILLIKEFSSKEENAIIYDYLYSMYLAQKEKDDSLKRLDLVDKSFETINNLEKRYIEFAKENLLFPVDPGFTTLKNYVYWEANKEMAPHYDNFHGEHAFPVMYGCIYYINDNFNGGELYYPGLDLEYKPVAGEMIIHPGTKEYSHGVRAVHNGVRITASSFITNKDMDDKRFTFEA
jgi:hypothetical protein